MEQSLPVGHFRFTCTSLGGQDLVSIITASSVDRLALKTGDSVAAVVKATEVMIAK